MADFARGSLRATRMTKGGVSVIRVSGLRMNVLKGQKGIDIPTHTAESFAVWVTEDTKPLSAAKEANHEVRESESTKIEVSAAEIAVLAHHYEEAAQEVARAENYELALQHSIRAKHWYGVYEIALRTGV